MQKASHLDTMKNRNLIMVPITVQIPPCSGRAMGHISIQFEKAMDHTPSNLDQNPKLTN